MWYLNHEPKETDMRAAFGFKADYNGIGVYMFKHRGNWRMMSIYNQGLEGLTVEAAVNNLSKCSATPFVIAYCFRFPQRPRTITARSTPSMAAQLI